MLYGVELGTRLDVDTPGAVLQDALITIADVSTCHVLAIDTKDSE